jgi:hypothetical protein
MAALATETFLQEVTAANERLIETLPALKPPATSNGTSVAVKPPPAMIFVPVVPSTGQPAPVLPEHQGLPTSINPANLGPTDQGYGPPSNVVTTLENAGNSSASTPTSPNQPAPPATVTESTTTTNTEVVKVDYTLPIVIGAVVVGVVALLILKHMTRSRAIPVPDVLPH